jgi:hypothetical protein
VSPQTAIVAPHERPLARRILAASAELLIAAVAGVAFIGIRRQVPDAHGAVYALAWFALANAIGLVALATATLATKHHPVIHHGFVENREAVGVTSRPVESWHSRFVDVTLIALCLVLLALDLSSGGQWLPWSLLLIIAASWLAVRLYLYIGRQKHVEGLWISPTDLIHQTRWGSERARLDQLTTVVGTRDALVIQTTHVDRRLCPRLWRGDSPRDSVIVVDTRLMGHSAPDIANWLNTRIQRD